MNRRGTTALLALVLCLLGPIGTLGAAADASAPLAESEETAWVGAFGAGYVMILEMSGVHEGQPFSDALYGCFIEHRLDQRWLNCYLSAPPIVGSVPDVVEGPAIEERDERWVCLADCRWRARVGRYGFTATVFGDKTLTCRGATAAGFPSAHSGGTFGGCTLE